MRRLLICLYFLSFSYGASAEITWFKVVNGKEISCTKSGLWSSVDKCDGYPEFALYVFVGRFTAIRSIKGDEKIVEITPEENFIGDPPPVLEIKTQQWLCGPEIKVGDRWLFDFDKPSGSLVFDPYATRSGPVSERTKEIETFRRLKTIGNFGLIRGTVGPKTGWHSLDEKVAEPIPDARVSVSRESDGAMFTVRTDAKGWYEFLPLEPGQYKLWALTANGETLEEGDWTVKPGSCEEITIYERPKENKGRISGTLQKTDGTPLPGTRIMLIFPGEGWTTLETDEKGHFSFEGLTAGKYELGVQRVGTPDWEWGSSSGRPPGNVFYFPGVLKRELAQEIEIGEDEEKDGIEFQLSPQ